MHVLNPSCWICLAVWYLCYWSDGTKYRMVKTFVFIGWNSHPYASSWPPIGFLIQKLRSYHWKVRLVKSPRLRKIPGILVLLIRQITESQGIKLCKEYVYSDNNNFLVSLKITQRTISADVHLSVIEAHWPMKSLWLHWYEGVVTHSLSLSRSSISTGSFGPHLPISSSVSSEDSFPLAEVYISRDLKRFTRNRERANGIVVLLLYRWGEGVRNL